MGNDWFSECSAQQKEALYRAEIENFSERMVVDLDGRIIFINEKFAAEFDKTPQTMEGQLWKEVIPPDEITAILDIQDFGNPYNPARDRLSMGPRSGQAFCRSPLCDNRGIRVGDIFYDGQDWLNRYRNLFSKLNELMAEQHDGKGKTTNESFIGECALIAAFRREIAQVAASNATLLIVGETGAGKEVVANEVFCRSARKDKNFVKLNCAALPQELIESELFGYESGAFTGARRGGFKGRFEQANGGVILLDEVDSLSLSAQAKLLRVLQEREVQPIGSESVIPIDVRVIAISNKKLEDLIEQGKFREDLYYRLNVLRLDVPPLRERKEDIPLFVRYFVEKCNREMDKHVDSIDHDVYTYLMSCPWPGNVRQLQNWVERAMSSVWKNILSLSNFFSVKSGHGGLLTQEGQLSLPGEGTLAEKMHLVEREIIQNALKRNRGNKRKTAQELGIARQNLYRKMTILEIPQDEDRIE